MYILYYFFFLLRWRVKENVQLYIYIFFPSRFESRIHARFNKKRGRSAKQRSSRRTRRFEEKEESAFLAEERKKGKIRRIIKRGRVINVGIFSV